MTPEEIEAIVDNIVSSWLGNQIGINPDKVDTSLSFGEDPPNGYSLTPGDYETMCDTCTEKINTAFHSSISLPGPWRTAHYNKAIAVFISDATDLIPGGLIPGGRFTANAAQLIPVPRR